MTRPHSCKNAAYISMSQNCAGTVGVGALFLYAALLAAFMLASEFIYMFNVKQGVEIELSRAVNTAVDLSMSDLHRQDHILELDAGIAYDQFFSYLRNDMSLNPQLELWSRRGACLYSLEIGAIEIINSPPSVRAMGFVAPRPLFLSRIAPAPIKFAISVSSANRRID